MRPLRRRRLIAATSVLVLVGGAFVARAERAYGDASSPTQAAAPTCPPAQAPPPGYPDPPPTAANSFSYNGHKFSGKIPYEIPFIGSIGSGPTATSKGDAGGTLTIRSTSANKPSILIPHLYAKVCGLIELPDLSGSLPLGAVNLAGANIVNGARVSGVVNVYIGANPTSPAHSPGAIEALPLSVEFGALNATVATTAAYNGGLDATINGSNSATLDSSGTPNPDTLGTDCPVQITSLPITTLQSGSLSGKPLTGPFHHAVAQVVGNNFIVPKIQPSATCPAVIAQTANNLLNLPTKAGQASLVAPIVFDFELQQAPPYNKDLHLPNA